MYFDKKNCVRKFRSQFKRKLQTSWQNGVNCVWAHLPFNSQSVNFFSQNILNKNIFWNEEFFVAQLIETLSVKTLVRFALTVICLALFAGFTCLFVCLLFWHFLTFFILYLLILKCLYLSYNYKVKKNRAYQTHIRFKLKKKKTCFQVCLWCQCTWRVVLISKVSSIFNFSLIDSSSGYQYDSKAFLFSLVNKPGWAPVKLPQTGKYSSYRYSIFSSSSYGPTFTGGGGDIYISNYASSNSNSLSNLGYTYSPPSGYSQGSTFAQTFLAGTYKFTPDEVETFYETNWKITMHFLISIPLVVNLLVVFTKPEKEM